MARLFAPLVVVLIGPGAAVAEVAQPVAVPSGMAVVFHDLVRGAPAAGLTYRFRFIAPAIAYEVPFEIAERDMAHLCETYALPRLGGIGPAPSLVVVSLSDRPVVFGEITPEATQFFEAYRPDGESCVWEGL